MTRNEEYQALLNELKTAPAALEFTVQRVKARAKRTRARRWFGVPVVSLTGVFAAFVLLVNLSTPFALACGSIPMLKGLTAAVAFSPSLKAAMEHDYVQYMGLEQTDGGVTMRVEYVIVDQKQVNIFFTLNSQAYGNMGGQGIFCLSDGAHARVFASFGAPPEDSYAVRQMTVDFGDDDVPAALTLKYEAWPIGENRNNGDAPTATGNDADPMADPEPVARFTFDLRFDPQYTTKGRTVAVENRITLDGQQIYVREVEIYPTHIRLNLEDDESNTAWLKGLEFYLEDESGNRYEKIKNGISATGSVDSPFYPSHRLESSYFGDAKQLTVYITGAMWLDKGKTVAHVDLAGQTAEGLPQGVTLKTAERQGGGVALTFAVDFGRDGQFNPFAHTYWDGAGTEYTRDGYSTSGGGQGTGFEVHFFLPDFPGDTVDLELNVSRYTAFPHAVAVVVA